MIAIAMICFVSVAAIIYFGCKDFDAYNKSLTNREYIPDEDLINDN